jgi:hypothetical protein
MVMREALGVIGRQLVSHLPHSKRYSKNPPELAKNILLAGFLLHLVHLPPQLETGEYKFQAG